LIHQFATDICQNLLQVHVPYLGRPSHRSWSFVVSLGDFFRGNAASFLGETYQSSMRCASAKAGREFCRNLWRCRVKEQSTLHKRLLHPFALGKSFLTYGLPVVKVEIFRPFIIYHIYQSFLQL